MYLVPVGKVTVFQSTPSVGRATLSKEKIVADSAISIHALRGEGDLEGADSYRVYFISIHALRGEGDSPTTSTRRKQNIFQSTPSVGRATLCAPDD